ncbi:MAG: heme ABC exporter ATP-binding protein CcmA [Rhodobacteraceae bacterium]|nr:heme ABC exporter ATP-binding protein CcmA [Paracoccaceae bacterium]
MDFFVDDLGCRRGEVEILSGVGFSLAPGQALVLRGPNGSGKTTLLRTLAGLAPAVRGRVVAPPESIAYAGHLDGLKAQLTVAENLAFWAAVFGGDTAAGGIDAALDGFSLRALSDRQAQHLSAGQKRRLGLSRLLVTGRMIWLLDEPTVSLDAASVAVFAGMVESHLAAGGMAVIATHIDLGLAAARDFDVTPFRARQAAEANPFLAGEIR